MLMLEARWQNMGAKCKIIKTLHLKFFTVKFGEKEESHQKQTLS